MLKDFLKAIDEERIEMHSVQVVQSGVTKAAHFWKWDENTRHVLHSTSKSVAVMAVGLAVDQKKLSLTDRLVDIFPDKLPEIIDEKLASLTVRHLLTMSSGHDRPLMMSTQRGNIPNPDWVQYYLGEPLDRMPGERFLYDSACTYLLSAIFQRTMKETLSGFVNRTILEPMGIFDAPWQACPMGITLGCAGLYLSPKELVKIGTLCLHRGKWEGRQLVPAWWLDECTCLQIDNSNYCPRRFREYRSGYGYQFWLCHNGAYRMDGSMGQMVFVWPEKDAVIVTTAAASEAANEPHAIMELIWEFLDPDAL